MKLQSDLDVYNELHERPNRDGSQQGQFSFMNTQFSLQRALITVMRLVHHNEQTVAAARFSMRNADNFCAFMASLPYKSCGQATY